MRESTKDGAWRENPQTLILPDLRMLTIERKLQDMSEITSSQNWASLALHSMTNRAWTRVGDGFEVAVVGRDAQTGGTAMFQRLTKSEAPLPEATPHSHPVACQTLVVSGAVDMTFESESRTLQAGDYLRVPAGTPHMQTLVSDSADLFVVTDGNPGIEFVVPQRWATK